MSRLAVKVEHVPVISGEVKISATEMSTLLYALPIVWKQVKLKDHWFYAPAKWADWRKIIDYILPKTPTYQADKFDCENNAGWWQIEVARLFKQNTMGDVEGWADMGRGKERHGWKIFYSPESKQFFQFEGQTGVVMDIDDPHYVPDEITMR